MMDKENNIYCLEANTLPGMTPTSLLPQEAAALGIDFAHLCEKLVEISLR
jgi:D-alanine-D-alanine ligase